MRDSTGTVKAPVEPQKAVLFDSGSLDTIDALGAGKAVIGASTKKLPAYLKEYKKVTSAGGIKEADLEKINALKPDLILISGRQRDFQEKLNKIAPTLYLAVNTKDTWNSTKQNTKFLIKKKLLKTKRKLVKKRKLPT